MALQDASEVWPTNALGSGQLYDFDLNDFGVQPDYAKDFLNGKVLIIHGVSESAFEGEFEKSARSLLHSWPTELGSASTIVYGALLSEDSPAIRQAEEMQRKGKTPFIARLRMVPSKAHKNQTYWTMERALLQYDADGRVVDPNLEPVAPTSGKSK